jgi:hypothetical protein
MEFAHLDLIERADVKMSGCLLAFEAACGPPTRLGAVAGSEGDGKHQRERIWGGSNDDCEMLHKRQRRLVRPLQIIDHKENGAVLGGLLNGANGANEVL